MISVRALERTKGLSDHALILMTIRAPSPQTNHRFKFELGRLKRAGFHDMVKGVWVRPTCAGSPIQRRNSKICSICSHLSCWERHESGILKKKKLKISSIIDDLEALAEVRPLLMQEIEI
jgi:hypothetical protein